MGSRILIDTNIIIDALRGFKPAISFYNSLDTAKISSITAIELLYGAKNKQGQRKIEDLLEDFVIIHIDEKISTTSFELIKNHFLSRRLMNNDAVIAATCLVNRLSLATKDFKDFNFINGLGLVKPY